MTCELIDVLDEHGKKTGEAKTIVELHSSGVYHQSVHVWLVNAKGEILVQKRSALSFIYAGYWDISVAGHASSGHSALETAQKETEEEVGLVLPPEAFCHILSFRGGVELLEGAFKDNEFVDVYVVESDAKIEDFVFTDGEVSAVRWLDRDTFVAWSEGKGEPMTPRFPEETRALFSYIDKRKHASRLA